MQDKSYMESDLMMRSLLADATENVPEGIWEAVSSRLDAAAGANPALGSAGLSAADGLKVSAAEHSRRARRWYWAAVPFAAAAALALGLVFRGTSDNSNLINIEHSQPLLSEAVPAENPTDRPGNDPSDGQIVENSAVRPGNTLSAGQIVENSTVRPENTPSAGRIAENTTTSPENDPSAGQADENPSSGTSDVRTAEQPADPFALLAFEDRKAACAPRRVSAVFGGGVSSNNAAQHTGARGAGGSYLQSDITETSKSDFGIPLTLGLGVRIPLGGGFSIGSGIDWSLLTRTFEGVYIKDGRSVTSDIRHSIQYVGIPLDLFYNIADSHDFGFYAVAGGEVERAISNRYTIIGTSESVNEKVSGVQWSVGAGLGMEFSLGSSAALFLEPSAKYYFNCAQPKNVRTDKPFQGTLRAGVRLKL